jgi:O-acetyl-ADP-ribose deacetylase (regulator of RNase III)
LIIKDGHGALLRARRRHGKRLAIDRAVANRHRGLVEGIHGEAKARHGLSRAHRRGLWNLQIQAWLTAAAINLKRLAKAYLRLLRHQIALQSLKRAIYYLTKPILWITNTLCQYPA